MAECGIYGIFPVSPRHPPRFALVSRQTDISELGINVPRVINLLLPLMLVFCASTSSAMAADDTKPSGDIMKLLAQADAVAGQRTARVCTVCHSVNKGEPAILGPNLYGIVNRPHAAVDGYHYSDALKATHDQKWDYESLNDFIYKPRAAIPGTKMTYQGMANDTDRANVIAWLRTLADTPQPLASPTTNQVKKPKSATK